MDSTERANIRLSKVPACSCRKGSLLHQILPVSIRELDGFPIHCGTNSTDNIYRSSEIESQRYRVRYDNVRISFHHRSLFRKRFAFQFVSFVHLKSEKLLHPSIQL